jgi:hypothetical protein
MWIGRGRLALRQSHSRNSRKQQIHFESLEPRELLAATAFISEVHPSGSGNGTYAADWFEITNPGPAPLDITGWKMDDNSNAFATAVPLRGLTSIPAGKSAVFFENSSTTITDASIIAAFSTAWFGSATPPAGFLIGAYGGSGVGLGGGGDSVNLFDAAGNRVTGISFGTASPARTFENVTALGSKTLPLPTVSTLSVAGVNGAFLSANSAETGSPGRLITGAMLDEAAVAVTGQPLGLTSMDLSAALDPAAIIGSRKATGGAAASAVHSMISQCEQSADVLAHQVDGRRQLLVEAQERLLAQARSTADDREYRDD